MPDNDISRSGAKMLAEAVKTNSTLTELHVRGKYTYEELYVRGVECEGCGAEVGREEVMFAMLETTGGCRWEGCDSV